MNRRHSISTRALVLIAGLVSAQQSGCRPAGQMATEESEAVSVKKPESRPASEEPVGRTTEKVTSVKPMLDSVPPSMRTGAVSGPLLPFKAIGAGHFNGTSEPLIPRLPSGAVMGLSPQRRFLVTGEMIDKMGLVVRVWDLSTMKVVLERQEPAGIEAIRFHPHGRSFTLDVGNVSDSKTWMELGAATALRPRQTDAGLASALAFSPDGRRVASTGSNQTVEIRDVTGSATRHSLSGHQHPVQVAAFSPDGRTLITGDAAGQLIGWDVTTGKKQKTWSFANNLLAAPIPAERHKSDLPAGNSSESNSTSAAGGGPVSPATASEREVSSSSASGLTAIAFSPDQSVLAVATANGYTQTFGLASGAALSPVFHQSPVVDIAFAADASSLLVVTQSGTVSRWWRAPAPPLLLTQQQGSVRFAALDAVGHRAVTGGVDRQLKVWDVDRQSLIRTLDNGGEAIATGALSPDGRRAVTAAYGTGIALWDLEGMKSLGKRYGHQKRVWAFAFAPDNDTFASAADDQTVRIWKINSPKPIRTIELDAVGRFVRFSPDGKRLLTATRDPRGWQFPARLQLWDTQTGKPLAEFQGHRMEVNSAVFSSDGKEITSCDAEGEICRWNAATGERLGNRRYPIGLSHSGLIAPHGLIVIRRYSSGVLISRAGDLTPVSSFDVPARSISDLNVAALGDRVIAGTDDGAVYVWRLGHE